MKLASRKQNCAPCGGRTPHDLTMMETGLCSWVCRNCMEEKPYTPRPDRRKARLGPHNYSKIAAKLEDAP